MVAEPEGSVISLFAHGERLVDYILHYSYGKQIAHKWGVSGHRIRPQIRGGTDSDHDLDREHVRFRVLPHPLPTPITKFPSVLR